MFLKHLLALPATKGLDGKFMLRELYEQVYGIADHISSTNPLELVLVQENENLIGNDPIDNIINQFTALDMYSLFGIPFDKFITLPSHQTKKMIASANNKREREIVKANELENKATALKE